MAADAADGRTGRARRWVFGLLVVGLWLGWISLPHFVAGRILDPSWQEAYNYFFVQRFQAGRDYAFTYGPYSWLLGGGYEARLYWPRWLIEHAVSLFGAWIVLRPLAAWSPWRQCLTGGPLILCGMVGGVDLKLILLVLALALTLAHEPPRRATPDLEENGAEAKSQPSERNPQGRARLLPSRAEGENHPHPTTGSKVGALLSEGTKAKHAFLNRPQLALAGIGGVLFALIGLGKFTNQVFVLLSIAAVVLATWRARRSNGVTLSVTFAVATVALWLAAGQSLGGVGEYVQTSLWIADGYTDGQSLLPDPTLLIIAVASTLATLTAIAMAAFAPSLPRSLALSLPRVLPVALTLLAALLVWKRGIVHFSSHVVFLLPAMAAVALVAAIHLPRDPNPRATSTLWRLVPAYLSLACVLLGYALLQRQGQFQFVHGSWVFSAYNRPPRSLNPFGSQRELEHWTEDERTRHRLPEVAAVVGDAPLDIFPPEQGVLFLNRFNWRPRPVFQGYSAYSERLMALNEAATARPSGPEYVLFRPYAIDGHYPPAEDSRTQEVLLRQFKPILVESDYLLLRRIREERHARLAEQTTLPCRLGEAFELPLRHGMLQRLTLDLHPTPANRLRKLAVASVGLTVEFTLTDGQARSFRLPVEVAKAGFVLNPFYETQSQFLALMAGEELRVARVTVRPESSSGTWYEPTFTAHLSTFEGWRSPPVPSASLRATRP